MQLSYGLLNYQVFLSVCEDLVECVVEEVLPELLRETVNSCLENIIHR